MIGGMAEGGDQGRATRACDVVVACPDRLKVAAAVKCRQIIVTRRGLGDGLTKGGDLRLRDLWRKQRRSDHQHSGRRQEFASSDQQHHAPRF